MFSFGVVLFALLVGFVPILIWLGFWLFEDRRHPEPKKLILRAFLVGMVSVLAVIPLERFAAEILRHTAAIGLPLIIAWAAIEETVKWLFAQVAVLRHRAVDEPIDVPIYLITVALGFAAFENMLFLITSLESGEVTGALITGNLRFIGATLIHVLSSATIGAVLAFVFFKSLREKLLWGTVGVILATALHALFNFSIISTSADWLLTIFAGVWVGITFLLLMLEKIKLLKRPAWWEKMFVKK